MDLRTKPLHALRDLAFRMGIHSPTIYKKDELIERIEVRKEQLENKTNTNSFFNTNLGRPRLNPCHIDLDFNENGKIYFFETDEYPEDSFIGCKGIKTVFRPTVKDDELRQNLIDVRNMLRPLLAAINEALEGTEDE